MRTDPTTWRDPRHRLGHAAEEAAAAWLTRRGWRVEAHRWRLGRHDLDLIVRRADLVAFVEVKLRQTTRCGAGVEAVGARKRRAIERAAWSWILRHGQAGDRYRFDVIAMDRPDGEGTVDHVADAWRPGWR